MEEYEKVAGAAGLVFIGVGISKALSYLYRLIVARIGVEEYGALSLALAIISILGIIALCGSNSGIIRFYSLYNAKKDPARKKGIIFTSMKLALFFSILLGSLLFAFSDWISLVIFNNTELSILLKILSFSLPFYVLKEQFCAVCTSAQKIKYTVLVKLILENLIKLMITFIFIFTAYKLIGATIAVLIAVISSFLLSFYFMQKKVFPIFSDINPIYSTKEFLRYSIPLFFGVLLIQILVWMDTLMIGYFRTVSEVGIYNVALQTGTLMSITPSAVVALFVPLMTGYLVQKKKEEFKKIFKICTKWIFFINLPIAILIFIFSKEILQILFGKAYVSGFVALRVLVVFYTIYQISTTSAEILKSLGKPKFILINTIIAACLNIFLNYMWIPKYGMVGGAFATGISLTIYALLGFFESFYFTKIFVFDKVYLKCIFACIISFLTINWLIKIINFHYIINVIILSSIFMMVYLLLIVMMKGISKEEIELIKTFKNKIINRGNK